MKPPDKLYVEIPFRIRVNSAWLSPEAGIVQVSIQTKKRFEFIAYFFLAYRIFIVAVKKMMRLG
jgi:hypothetical protein